MGLTLMLNGQRREFEELESGAALDQVIAAMGLKADRVAVEWNGAIVGRAKWGGTTVSEGDKLEVVHFVGGGCAGGRPDGCGSDPA